MGYVGKGEGKQVSWAGSSPDSVDDAIRAAVGASDVEDGTILVVTHIEVKTVDDPNVGSYHVVLSKSGGG
jgi:flavin-binding protein dodecin